jgi:hypothetical protein
MLCIFSKNIKKPNPHCNILRHKNLARKNLTHTTIISYIILLKEIPPDDSTL